jgi:hypothetical protein
MEVKMKFMKSARAMLLLCLALSAAMSARAATAYTLTCEPVHGAVFTIPLTGFDFKVTGGATTAAGMASGKRGSFELMFRFEPSSMYNTLLEMTESNETLKSCRLTDGLSGTTAKDNWTQMEMQKGAINRGNNQQAAGSGAMVWTFTNAIVTSVLAIGNENNAGVATGSIQVTLTAERFEFTMQ